MMSKSQDLSYLPIDKPAQVHALAVVDPKAELDSGVVVGPGSVVGADVKIGAETWVGPNVVLDGHLEIGSNNKIFPGACLGLEPQDLKYKGAPTKVVIGDRNTIREYVTINRATEESNETRIGNGNLLMAYCHLGHNSLLGNGIVMSNGIQVAGHVLIEDKAVIGGCAAIHQFVHIGELAMIGGMTKVVQDVPPYCLVDGNPGRLRGLNRLGLRRSGLKNLACNELRQLQEIWTLLFRSEHILVESLELARHQDLMPKADHLCCFLEDSLEKGRRGPMGLMHSKN